MLWVCSNEYAYVSNTVPLNTKSFIFLSSLKSVKNSSFIYSESAPLSINLFATSWVLDVVFFLKRPVSKIIPASKYV